MRCLLLGLLISSGIYGFEAPIKACRVQVKKDSEIIPNANRVKNSGCAILKYDSDLKPTHVLMYLDKGDKGGYSLPGGKRAAQAYDPRSKESAKFDRIAKKHGIEYSESAHHTACRETREETQAKMKNGQGLEVIVGRLINPKDKYFFAFECFAPDIDQLQVTGGKKLGDFRWIGVEEVSRNHVVFNYSNEAIVRTALGMEAD